MEQKQHHYIPKCYSKNFTSVEDDLCLRDIWNNKNYAQKPEKALRQQYMYSQPVHAERRFDNIIENFFSQEIETGWPSLVDAIRNRNNIKKENWGNLIQFMIATHVRVPNRMKAIIEALRQCVVRASESISDAATADVNAEFRKIYPSPGDDASLSNLIRSGRIAVNIDPHRAVSSLPYIIKNLDSFINIGENPRFLHNRSNVDFISSDNPVVFHNRTNAIEKIVPFSYSTTESWELIFPITSKVALFMQSDSSIRDQHRETFSAKTVQRINTKVALYADRHIFASSASHFPEWRENLQQCPIPKADECLTEDGLVYRLKYEWGAPLEGRENWEYDFNRSESR
ncbi:DUF4238 domain-containing protein [Aurantimonas sp. C2-6-R+9]|uniref:DUF4238 domain-containing protein n=1 Tax=unclassified Aurantimonas TaxID=2638230 RepID=UPI002E17C719|nr:MULTISPECIES: DUF4238 domain-containing protein [unclassified Aurantimonas]MEC5289020.1 DUF4238 domain-containing protein [Aurantimonas sp. C2-3-R2]MEC5379405.1 DUF4238 domain-containing protein [Aurantimonas sp. C2-6-R+9]MEC5410158.1 DUF4238 domain-containing protein [Aurantimonas sp. C2-4-R8]